MYFIIFTVLIKIINRTLLQDIQKKTIRFFLLNPPTCNSYRKCTMMCAVLNFVITNDLYFEFECESRGTYQKRNHINNKTAYRVCATPNGFTIVIEL